MTGEVAAARDDFGPVDFEPLTRIQQIGGNRLQASWPQVPQVTHFEEADITGLDAARRRSGESAAAPPPSLLASVARASIDSLREFPRFCASLDASRRRVVLKRYVNLGLAIDTPQGLVVAVIHDAADMPVGALGSAIADLAARGRTGKLKPSEMEGSCFTISSLGNLGGVGFTPIVNPPEVAILGVSPARLRPQWIDDAVVPRLILPLSLSYDHRVIGGADAARFCRFLCSRLA